MTVPESILPATTPVVPLVVWNPDTVSEMLGDDAKAHLHDHVRWARDALVWKLDGLSEYEIRRPVTSTGTNLLGLVKHVAIWDSRYLGGVFDRPFPGSLPAWDDADAYGTDHWATVEESKSDIVGLFGRVRA